MKIKSIAFSHNARIPKLYTCEGKGTNPPLEFLDVPQNAKSLVLLVEDPDVPKYLREDGLWVHWLLFNLPPHVKKIAENSSPACGHGMTTSETLTFVAPCPPDRQHRYFFKLYALDCMLNLKNGSSKDEVLQAMQGHILAQAEMIGLYQKES